MSAPSPPPDNSFAVAQMQQDASDKAAVQAKQDAADAATKLAALRTSSATNATNSTNQYFQNLGLDPTKYSGDIDSQIQAMLSGIDPSDPNPGSTFQGADQTIYNNLTKQFQTKSQNDLNNIYTPSFQSTKLPFSMDQPYVASDIASQRSSADAIIQNMLKRGVLTSTGADAAEANLDSQQPAIQGQVQQLADDVISGGQQKLSDIAGQAKTDAGTLQLGQTFDPTTYTKQTDDAFNQFVNNLGTSIQAKIPGNLFQTNGLAAIGGAAQGAGNTAYDPNAAAGVGVPPPGKGGVDPNALDTNANSTKESIF